MKTSNFMYFMDKYMNLIAVGFSCLAGVTLLAALMSVGGMV